MGQTPPLTEAAVRRLARRQSYDRGENYYQRGAVVDVVRRGESLRAEVEGSQYEPYQVRINLNETGITDTHCSCPYDHGGICKHRVAVLLTYIRDPETISQRPPVPALLEDLDRETLHELLVDLLADHPELEDWVERRIEAQSIQGSAEDASGEPQARHTPPDPDTIRRHVRSIIQSSDPRGTSDPYEDVESRVNDLRDLLKGARAYIDTGNGEEALVFLEAMAEELMDEEWLALSYDDSAAIFEFLDELSAAFTEAILTAKPDEMACDEWAVRLTDWADELAGYTPEPPFRAAVEAAEQGWDAELLQAALQGTADEQDLWTDERPWYADELITALLNVLEREDRTEEYLNVARATDHHVRYATKLIEVDRHEEAVKYSMDQCSTPNDALKMAKSLREDDHPEDAIEVARHGLSLDGIRKKELAEWLCNLAAARGDDETAREAAVAAFEAEPSLATYQAAEEVAGDEWSDIREELLAHLKRRRPGRSTPEHVDIFLYEGLIDEAITIAERSGHYTVVEPVVDAVWEERPDWVIDVCKEQAEPIIEEGQSDRYRHAVRWLEKAGKAAQAAGKLDEWCAYVEDLRDEQYRKYKLRPMLEDLLEEFSC